MSDKDKDKGEKEAKASGGVGKGMWGALLGAVLVSGAANVGLLMKVDSSVGGSAEAAEKALEKRLTEFEEKMSVGQKPGKESKEIEALKEMGVRQKKMEERLDQLEGVLLEMAKSWQRIEEKTAGRK